MLGLAVPLYNEAARLDVVVADFLAALAPLPFRLALVDNGSADQTGPAVDAWAAADSRVCALHTSPNAGYGGGIRLGLDALLEDPAISVLGWAWGDGQVDPAVIPALYAAIKGGNRLAKARRVERQDGWQRLLTTRVYGRTTRALGLVTADVNGCPKLLDRAAYTTLAPRHTGWFLDAEVVIGAEAHGWPIFEAPVTMRPRAAGRSKVRPQTALAFARDLVAWRLSGRP